MRHTVLKKLGRVPQERFYTKHHQWIQVNERTHTAKIGITEYGQDLIGEVMFVGVDSINTGIKLEKGKEFCHLDTFEGRNRLIHLHMPLAAKVTKVNDLLNDHAIIINRSPEEEGWIAEVQLSKNRDIDSVKDKFKRKFMDREEYQAWVEQNEMMEKMSMVK